MMILFPAIDLKDGVCVRLEQGDINRSTEFSDDPAGIAAGFAASGCEWLHVVDLDGAMAGRSVNGDAVEAILKAVDVPVQLGGGIRDLTGVETWLGKGVSRVVLGTAAARDPDFLARACRVCPDQIAVGIDVRDDRVGVEGWAETLDLDAETLAKRSEDAGAAAIIFTDIMRDGMRVGVNAAATGALAKTVSIPVIASGGVASLDDLVALKAVEGDGVAGVVVGRALYDGSVSVKDALAALKR